MTKEELALYAIKGMVAELPEDEKARVVKATEIFNKAFEEAGEAGILAVQMILLEIEIRGKM